MAFYVTQISSFLKINCVKLTDKNFEKEGALRSNKTLLIYC